MVRMLKLGLVIQISRLGRISLRWGLSLVKWRDDLALATNLHQMGCCLTTAKPFPPPPSRA
ncbi:hypothetical protein LINPERPRIM_LOCUS29970 [Linum perenne]